MYKKIQLQIQVFAEMLSVLADTECSCSEVVWIYTKGQIENFHSQMVLRTRTEQNRIKSWIHNRM